MEGIEEETKKWQKKLENKKDKLEPNGEEGKDFVDNIKAYLEDSYYFQEESDHLRAFESIIWAWAWFEIGKDYGFIHIS